MQRSHVRGAAITLLLSASVLASAGAVAESASPLFGVTIPDGYRHWELIAASHESEPLNELRAILGNPVATKAYQNGVLPFPDGTVLAKLGWKHVASTESPPAYVPGDPTTVQIMVKNSKRYADTGGWGVRPVRWGRRRRRSAAPDLLRLPSGLGEKPRLRLYALGPLRAG